MPSSDLRFRAIQLDLASQRETPEFIRQFIEFAARYGFNTLLLYLEWRVRTTVFDLGPENGYSKEELRGILDCAARHGMTVIPGLAALGHAQMVTRKPGFEQLDELRDGSPGRFGTSSRLADLCPSQPETRALLEAYFTEVAAMFSGPFLHVGGDEAWNIGCCPLCRAKARSFTGEAELYRDHFLFCHAIVSGKLGKRMMLWDDMFEYYPDILADFPRDVVMVDWQYQDNVTGYRGHFANQNFSDRAALYDRLGFEYWGACAHYSFANPESTLRYAQNRRHRGLLLTYWGVGLPFHTFPFFAAAGLLWDGRAADSGEAVRQCAEQLFKQSDPVFVSALHEYLDTIRWVCGLEYHDLTTAPQGGFDHAELTRTQLLHAVFSQYRSKVSDPGTLYLAEMLDDLELKALRWRSRIAAWNRRHRFPAEDFARLERELVAFTERRRIAVSRFRRDASSVTERLECWLAALRKFDAEFKEPAMLRLTLVQPDQFSFARLAVDAFADGAWRTAVEPQVCKELSSAVYEADFPLPPNWRPERLRLTVRGFGGQGIAYVEVLSAGERRIPGRITVTAGTVEHPEYLAFPDLTCAVFGCARTLAAFHDRKLAEQPNTVEIELIPVSPGE